MYFLQPLLFIVRDYLLNLYVRKFVLTEEVHHAIQMRATDVWAINTKGKSVQVRATQTDTTYFIDGQQVTEEQYSRYTQMMNFHRSREAKSAELIRARSFQLERLFRHYKQDGKNPIPAWEEQAYKRVSASYNKSLEQKRYVRQHRVASRRSPRPGIGPQRRFQPAAKG